MNILWQSPDGYVVVADDVQFPDPNEAGESQAATQGDLAELFQAGAWIVVWRPVDYAEQSHKPWRFTRNRRFAKPGLGALRQAMDRNGFEPNGDALWIAPSDAHGHLWDDTHGGSWESAIGVGQSFYAAWGCVAAGALPNKIRHLGLSVDEPAADQVPAWMRPGLPEYAKRRREVRELLSELQEAA